MVCAGGVVQESGFTQKYAEFVDVMRSELLAILYREFERRALQVAQQDLEVVRVDVRVLRRAVEEVLRVLDDVLIERRTGSHQDCGRRRLTASRAPGALPRRRDGAGVTGSRGYG